MAAIQQKANEWVHYAIRDDHKAGLFIKLSMLVLFELHYIQEWMTQKIGMLFCSSYDKVWDAGIILCMGSTNER